jgi:hypothetical protein
MLSGPEASGKGSALQPPAPSAAPTMPIAAARREIIMMGNEPSIARATTETPYLCVSQRQSE